MYNIVEYFIVKSKKYKIYSMCVFLIKMKNKLTKCYFEVCEIDIMYVKI